MLLNNSAVVGGVKVIALAPAFTVASTDSLFGPPVAMIGTSGNFSLIALTTSGVRAAADTLSMSAPASSRPWMSSFSFKTVTITGISNLCLIELITWFLVGAFTTTPIAPCCSASTARPTTRGPLVVPPPTPEKTGISAAWVIA